MNTVIERSAAIEQAKQSTIMGKDRLIKTFGFVPDDKLNWTPAATCKSALRIVAHCAISNAVFQGIINREPFPENMDEMMAEGARAEQAITTREEAIKTLEATTAAYIAAMEALTPEQINSEVVTPFLTAPMTFFMNIPGRHFDNHAAQIDYLQTCWGDMDWHF